MLIGSHESNFFCKYHLSSTGLSWLESLQSSEIITEKMKRADSMKCTKGSPTPKPCKAHRRLLSFINHWLRVKDQGTQVKPHLEKAIFVDWRPCCRGGRYLGVDNISKSLTTHVVHVQSKLTVRADLMLPGNRLGFFCLHSENGVA